MVFFPCSLQIVKPWKQKDHLLLAKTLAAALQLSYGRKMAFILGSLIPDINPLSYLSPSCEKKFDGHSYEYRRRFIEESLKVSSCNRCTDWYRAGVAVHYLADSFTRPHNESFAYRWKEHVAYEHSLHQKFQGQMKELKKLNFEIGDLTAPGWYEEQHGRYLKESRGCCEDCQYIIRTTAEFCNHLIRL